MAKKVVLGNFCKSKDPTKPPYLKFKTGVTFNENDVVRVESKKFQAESLERAIADGKVTGDNVEKARARVEKIPEWILGELVRYES